MYLILVRFLPSASSHRHGTNKLYSNRTVHRWAAVEPWAAGHWYHRSVWRSSSINSRWTSTSDRCSYYLKTETLKDDHIFFYPFFMSVIDLTMYVLYVIDLNSMNISVHLLYRERKRKSVICAAVLQERYFCRALSDVTLLYGLYEERTYIKSFYLFRRISTVLFLFSLSLWINITLNKTAQLDIFQQMS